MSKKHRDKVCVYCGEAPSECSDHVIARGFFINSARGNLPKVPACLACNVAKSALETYATAVLPFGGRHADASTTFQMVDGRLMTNQKLSRSLSQGMERAWTRTESGTIVPTITIPVDDEKIRQLFCYIARGLAAHHWSTIMGGRVTAEAYFLTREGQLLFEQQLTSTANQCASGNLGNGVLEYQGAQGIAYPAISVRVFRIYSGVPLTGDKGSPSEVSSAIGVLTGPVQSFERAELSRAWLTGARLVT